MKRTWTVAVATIGLGLGLALSGCSSSESGESAQPTGEPVVVATTNFSETKILASMYQQVLEKNGIPATIRELTTREVIVPALKKGEVQVTPEYLSSLADFLNKSANGPDAESVTSGDVTATKAAADELAGPAGLTLLEASPAQDQNAFAVTADVAEQAQLQSLSDLAEYSKSSPISLGGPPECPQRSFCQLGLEQVYGVKVGEFVALDAGGPLTISALKQGKVQVGVVFSSSGSVTANDLVVLQDDKGLQNAENLVPAVNSQAVTEELSAALNSVSAALTTQELQALNAKVEIDRQDPEQVATDFLTDKGLL